MCVHCCLSMCLLRPSLLSCLYILQRICYHYIYHYATLWNCWCAAALRGRRRNICFLPLYGYMFCVILWSSGAFVSFGLHYLFCAILCCVRVLCVVHVFLRITMVTSYRWRNDDNVLTAGRCEWRTGRSRLRADDVTWPRDMADGGG
jgi:hypothetical protein